MTDILYRLDAHAEALTDLARIRAAQAMLDARDEILRLRKDALAMQMMLTEWSARYGDDGEEVSA